jgi:arsenate reductase-like glutaredoxin family protein
LRPYCQSLRRLTKWFSQSGVDFGLIFYHEGMKNHIDHKEK